MMVTERRATGWRRLAGGYGTALALTMALFSAPVPVPGRLPAAIVRPVARRHDGRFDPRELVGADAVLTVPLGDATRPAGDEPSLN